MHLPKLLMGIVAAAMYAISAVVWSMPILDGGWDTTDSDGSLYSDHIDAVTPALNAGGALPTCWAARLSSGSPMCSCSAITGLCTISAFRS